MLEENSQENLSEKKEDIVEVNNNPSIVEEERKYIGSDEQLANARYYKNLGGKINLLFDKYKGVNELFAERFVNKKRSKRMNAIKFREELKQKFPHIPEEEIPSDVALRKWKLKYFKAVATGEGSNVLAMKDEVRIISVMQNFNFFEEQMIMYKKSKKVLKMAEDILERAYELSKKMNVPTSAFTASIADFFKALEGRGLQLDKLDSLAVRFGFMPPKSERALVGMNTQINNYTLSDDHQQIKEELGLTDDDFSDDKMSGTMEKILAYVGKSGNSIFGLGPKETSLIDEESIVSTKSTVNNEGGGEARETEAVG